MIRCLVVLCAAGLVAACASSPTAPSGPTANGPRTGVWSGTVSDTVNGPGTMRLQLSDYAVDGTRSVLSGSWSTTYADTAKNGRGPASGTASGATAALAMTPSAALPCPTGTVFAPAAGSFLASELAVGATTIAGSYVLTTCSGSVNGTLDLRKQ